MRGKSATREGVRSMWQDGFILAHLRFKHTFVTGAGGSKAKPWAIQSWGVFLLLRMRAEKDGGQAKTATASLSNLIQRPNSYIYVTTFAGGHIFRPKPTTSRPPSVLNSTWLDVTAKSCGTNGLRFFAVKNAGILTSPSCLVKITLDKNHPLLLISETCYCQSYNPIFSKDHVHRQ